MCRVETEVNFDSWIALASLIACFLIVLWFIWYTYNEEDLR